MSEQWTEDRVEQCLANHGAKGLAEVINAALAAKRNVLEAERKFNESTIVELEEQLVAEREKSSMARFAPLALEEVEELRQKVKLLVDALEDLRRRLVPGLGNKTDHEVLRQIDVVLEKVKDWDKISVVEGPVP